MNYNSIDLLYNFCLNEIVDFSTFLSHLSFCVENVKLSAHSSKINKQRKSFYFDLQNKSKMHFQSYRNMIHSSGACDKIAFCLWKSTELLPSVIEFNAKDKLHSVIQLSKVVRKLYTRICRARVNFPHLLCKLLWNHC